MCRLRSVIPVPYKKQNELGREVEDQVKLAIRAAGLDNCPVNCDLIEKNGKIYVIEITGRAGEPACRRWSALTMESMIMKQSFVWLSVWMCRRCSDKISGTANLSRTCFRIKDGIVKAIHNANKPAADIVDLSFNIVPGDEVHHYTNGRDRLGQVILRRKSCSMRNVWKRFCRK